MGKTIRVLSLDGGGIRGVIPAVVLAELERLTGRPISESFDLIAGTSTGGILALGLVTPDDGASSPKFSAADLVGLYEDNGRKIFHRSLWHEIEALGNLLDEKYSAHPLEEVLHSYFGDTMLSEALTEVIVPSYEIEQRIPFFFKSRKARTDSTYDFPLEKVARATSAAPTFFEPLRLEAQDAGHTQFALIDGGVYANNPAVCAYVEARDQAPDADRYIVVSIGTGEATRPIAYEQAKGWGLAMWAKPILSVVFHGVSETVDYQLKILCQTTDAEEPLYYRFQTTLDRGSDDMDNASATNIWALKTKAEELVDERRTDLERLARQLTQAATPVAVA